MMIIVKQRWTELKLLDCKLHLPASAGNLLGGHFPINRRRSDLSKTCSCYQWCAQPNQRS